MSKILHTKAVEVAYKHKDEHEGYGYYRHELVPRGFARQCTVSLYEIPPGKSHIRIIIIPKMKNRFT